MNLVRKTVAATAAGVAVADDMAALSAFTEPGCAAAVWPRHLPAGFGDWINGLAPEQLPCGRVVTPAAEIAAVTRALFDEARTPAGPHRDWLARDIATLAAMFAEMNGARHLRLRLDVVDTNACRRFHIDAIRARLVCTYRGTGTQYGISTAGAEPDPIFTVDTGSPFLMRGTLWPAKPATGLLHRSPPIEGSGETRLLLVLDPIYDPDDAS